MNRRRIVLVILIALLLGFGVIRLFNEITPNDDHIVVRFEIGSELNKEQNELLADSILDGELKELEEIEHQNAWLMLEIMKQIGFEEGRPEGQSGVALAVYIMEIVGVGQFTEITVVEVISSHISPMSDLVLRAINTESEVYYIRYNRTWGLSSVRRGAESVHEGGENVFSRTTHFFDFEGNLIKRE